MKSAKKTKTEQDFTISILVDKTPKEAFDAINDVKAWWIGEVEGRAIKVGDKFTYQYKKFHQSTQKVKELKEGKKVVWLVEDANLSFAKNKTEWTGTELVFEISPQKNGKTEIKFTHQGLTPEFECYEACSGGWQFYISKSLNNLLKNGKGLDPGF